MSVTPGYDPGPYSITPYTLVEIVYEPRGWAGMRAKYMWSSYDFPPEMPALKAFLEWFVSEHGVPLTTQTVAAWNVDHRTTYFGSATASLQ